MISGLTLLSLNCAMLLGAKGVPLDIDGKLEVGDPEIQDDKFSDWYDISVDENQKLAIWVNSGDFDTYLYVQPPFTAESSNDDTGQDNKNSSLVLTNRHAGIMRVGVTSYEDKETGSYDLHIRDISAAQVVFDQAGVLGPDGSDSKPDGEEGAKFEIPFEVDVQANQLVLVELQSAEFDTFLIVEMPNGQRLENDDLNGSLDESMIFATTQAAGKIKIIVTSYDVNETGNFTLKVSVVE